MTLRRAFAGDVAPAALVAGLVVALAARTLLTTWNVAPWIMVDELIYSELAKSIASTGELRIRGESGGFFSLLYPVLISPAWLAPSMATTYAVAKAINAALMTLALVPFYLWARRLVAPPYAVLASALVLLLPSFFYAGTLMTENAFLPAFVFAAFAIALALERPAPGRQALALGAIAIASAVRLQGLVLVLVLVSAIGLYALLDLRARATGEPSTRAWLARLGRYRATGVALAIALAAYVGVAFARNEGLSSGLGAYRPIAETDYSALEAARWSVFHFGGLAVAVGVAGFAALVVLFGSALKHGSNVSAAERAFLAVAVSAVFWFTVVAGTFASRFANRIEERNMLYVEPLLLLALAIWLARGLPRPRKLTALAVVLAAALVLALPLATILTTSIVSDTFGLIPLYSLLDPLGVDGVRAVLWGGTLLALAAFALVPRRPASFAVPLLAAAVLVGSSVAVFRETTEASRAVRSIPGVGDDVSWVNDVVDGTGDVGFLLTADVDPHALWQTQFWNRRVRTILELGTEEPGGLPRTRLSLDHGTGALVTESARRAPSHLLSRDTHLPAGSRIAERGQWVVYRIEPPLRLARTTEGLYPDGWIGSEAAFTVYGAKMPAATVAITLSRAAPAEVPSTLVRVEARPLDAASAATEKTAVVRSAGTTLVAFRAPSPPFRVELHVARTFSPADYGLLDSRSLGVQVGFRLLPAGA